MQEGGPTVASLIVRRASWLVVEVPDEVLSPLLDSAQEGRLLSLAPNLPMSERVRRLRSDMNESGATQRLVTESEEITVSLLDPTQPESEYEIIGFDGYIW